MKWYVIADRFQGVQCVGINDESYYGDGGEIISTHDTGEQAEAAAKAYAQASGLPLFADIKEEFSVNENEIGTMTISELLVYLNGAGLVITDTDLVMDKLASLGYAMFDGIKIYKGGIPCA